MTAERADRRASRIRGGEEVRRLWRRFLECGRRGKRGWIVA